jgi:hypothetical protein
MTELSKIKLHIDEQSFNRKPDQSEAGKIVKNIIKAVSEVTPQALAEKVGLRGHSVCLATMGAGADGIVHKRNANMVQQQALALDFDNKEDGVKTEGLFYQSISDALEHPFIQEHAAFLYKSFSSADGWDRYRVVFILDEPLTTEEEVYGAYGYLQEIFPLADKKVKEPSRLFYGGCQEVVEINYNNTLAVEDLPAVEKVAKAAKPARIKTAKTPKLEVIEGAVPTWKLIKQGKKEEVKARWSVYGNITLSTKATCIQYFKENIPMAEALGISTNPFRDIFEYDEKPSASIWLPEDSNAWLYTQLNSDSATGRHNSLNMIQVVQKLLTSKENKCPWGVAIQYLIDVTGVNIEVTQRIKEVRDSVEMFQQEVLLSSSLKYDHPEMGQILGRYGYEHKINAILDIYKNGLYEEDGEMYCLTRMTVEQMANDLHITKDKAHYFMTLMSLVFMTDKLDDSEIPTELLAELKLNQTHYYDEKSGSKLERAKPREYRQNVIRLNNLMESFDKIEERCVVLVANSYKRRSLCREWAIRMFGTEEADRLFPQDEGRTISKITDAFTEQMVNLIFKEFAKKPYIEEVDLKLKLQKKWKSKGFTDRKYDAALGYVIEAYGLKKGRLNKSLTSAWGLPAPKNSRGILYKEPTANNITA